jgi:hypothetical protein
MAEMHHPPEALVEAANVSERNSWQLAVPTHQQRCFVQVVQIVVNAFPLQFCLRITTIAYQVSTVLITCRFQTYLR